MASPTIAVTIGPADAAITCAVLDASVHHGRDDPANQPDASTATINLLGPLPPEAVIGARVRLVATLGGTSYDRFTGTVTDLGVGWDDVDHAVPQIIAAGDLALTGRRMVGDVPWPAELEGARVSRVLGLAGFPPDPLLTDPGRVTVLARDVDRQPALDVAQDAALDGGGIVWQTRGGKILYADSEHRRGSAVAVALDTCDLGVGLAWSETMGDLANDVTVLYGVGSPEQPSVRATNPTSIAQRGTYALSISTRIESAADANARAALTVGRRAYPSWALEGVELELTILDAAMVAAILGLDVHSLVSVTGLPAGSPAPSAYLWVEGWHETIEPTSWLLAMATSDYCRSGAYSRWDDVEPAATWDTMDPATTWDDTACLPPRPPAGRWNDVPASLRWNQNPPATTWDSWR